MGGIADDPNRRPLPGLVNAPDTEARLHAHTPPWRSPTFLVAVIVGAVGLWFGLAQLVGLVLSVGITGVAAGAVAGLMVSRSSPSVATPLAAADEAAHSEAGWEVLQAEVARSRRYGHPLVLVTIPEGVWLNSDAEPEPAEQALAATRAVEPVLRTSDHAWSDGSTIYIMLAECNVDQTRQFLARARSSLPALFPSGGRLGYAAFPVHAVTVGGLLDALQPLDLDELTREAA